MLTNDEYIEMALVAISYAIVIAVFLIMLFFAIGCGEAKPGYEGYYDANAPDLSHDEYIISNDPGTGDITITERMAIEEVE